MDVLNKSEERHPIPCDDGMGIFLEEESVFGFQSLDSLINWFNEIIDNLAKEGWYVATYKVKKKFVRFGRSQICFRRDKAMFVEYLNK